MDSCGDRDLGDTPMQRIGIRDGDRWILLPWFVLWLAVGAGAARAAEPYQAAAELRAQYAADIERLAQWCDSCGLTEQAGQTRAAVTPQEPGKIFMPVLPLEIGPPKLPPGSPQRLVSWDKRLWDFGSSRPRNFTRWPGRPGPLAPREPGLRADAGRDPGESRLRPRAAGVGLPEVPQRVADPLRSEEAARGDGFQRQVRLDVEAEPCQVRGRAAALARPLDLGRRGRPGTPRHGPAGASRRSTTPCGPTTASRRPSA